MKQENKEMWKQTFFELVVLFMVTQSCKGGNDKDVKETKSSNSVKSDSKLKDMKEVIVIGGGIAGIAAARKLTNHRGFHVTLFEACEDRYGGRVWTNRKSGDHFKGTDADMGAMWLNSHIKDNALIHLVRTLELKTKSPGPVQLYVPGQNKVFKGDDVNKIFSDMVSIIRSGLDKAHKSEEDIPLSEVIQKELQKLKTGGNKEVISALISSHYALSVQNYSAHLFKPEKDFGWDTVVVDGFDQVIDGMVGGLEGEVPVEVELGAVARQIEVDKKRGKVMVRTTDLKQYAVDAVVVALPLGVLKNDSVLFEPYLPKEWYKTVRKLGVSYTNKVVLEFDKVFWPTDVGVFTLAPSDPSEIGLFQTWINMHQLVGRPVLMGTLNGARALEIEQLSDADIKEIALRVLSNIFEEKTLKSRSITMMLRSKWQTDTNTLGGNTYPIYGVGKDNIKHLSNPVCPHIYLAGEYTDLENMSTLLGAYNSGIRAAEQIINDVCATEEKTRKSKKQKKSDTKSERKSDLQHEKDEL